MERERHAFTLVMHTIDLLLLNSYITMDRVTQEHMVNL